MHSPKEINIISKEEMLFALKKSGYLIEQRVENVLKKNNFITSANSIYVDHETNITKEIDIKASSIIKPSENEHVSMDIICECENNNQPVIFFESDYDYIDYTQGIKSLNFPKFINAIFLSETDDKDQKSLFNGKYSTQYCSFHKPKQNNSNWIALHPDEQHNTFESFIKYFQSLRKRIEKSYYESFSNERLGNFYKIPRISGSFTYFLLVLQGDIYSAKMKEDELELEPTSHIKFIKTVPTESFSESFYIDVIQEKYLEEYLKYFKMESRFILNNIKKNRKRIIKEKLDEYSANEKIYENFKINLLKNNKEEK